MAERGIGVDHSTIHRWVVHFSPRLLERFNRRKRAVTRKWHVDETYIKVRGKWMYLYRATAPATPSSSGSVNTGTCWRPNGFSEKRLNAMGGPRGWSSTAGEVRLQSKSVDC